MLRQGALQRLAPWFQDGRRFTRGFCALASDAVARVHAAFPDLTLVMRESLAAPQGMAMVH